MATKKKTARKSAVKKRASPKKKATAKRSARSKSTASSPALRSKVRRIMREYKGGTLRSRSKSGPRVRSRRQAVAIALSETGLSRRTTSKKGRARRRAR